MFFNLLINQEYLLQPKLLDINKADLICDVVNYNYCMSSFIVSTGYCAKPFLSSCIPNLQFYNVPRDRNGPELSVFILKSEIDSDGSKIALLEGIISEPTQKGRFAHRAVAD